MPDQLYQTGDPVPLHAEFRNAAGVLTNTSVALEVTKPDGTALTPPTVTNTSTGVYDATVAAGSIDQTGVWFYAFIGSGAVAQTDFDTFLVEARPTATGAYPFSTRALVGLEETREYVLGDRLNNGQDEKLIRHINRYSEAIFRYTKREWKPQVSAAARRFIWPGYGMLSLAPYDLRTATSVVAFTDYPTSYQMTLVPGDAVTLAEYKLRAGRAFEVLNTYRWIEFSPGPYTTAPQVWPYDYDWDGQVEVTVTGNWGIGSVPEDVKLAVLIAVRNIYENPEAAGIRSIGPLTITEPIEAENFQGGWFALPRDSRALLAEFRDDPALAVAA